VGVIWTASTNLIGGAVSGANRGTAIGVYVTSAPAGFALGQLFGPIVTARAGWPANFLVMSVVAGLVIGVISLSVRRLEIDPVTNTASIRSNFTSVLSHRVVWVRLRDGVRRLLLLPLRMNSWMPTYLGNEFALSAGLSGLLTAAFPAMGVLSRAGGGLISDRLLGQRRVPLLQASFLVSVPLVVLIGWTRHLAVIVAALVAAGFVIQLTFGVVYSYVQEVVETSISGTALAFVTSAGISGRSRHP